MASFTIPEQLQKMVRERRIIPFIGAGFSQTFDLPNWVQLLKELSTDIQDGLDFNDVFEMCDGNLLQIAEYLYLMKDRQIGPIRQKMSEVLHGNIDPVLSGAHVELVNLGSPLIYTTNYDNFIEKVFKNLGHPCETIALPRQVAYSDGKNTQIIKYHGDFSYDETLVLTESSYYSRMNFDSPLDLKFRSELFARSVLFVGYSFRDINIRIIWYRLMEMMKDIAATDRPDSYIVRIEPNKVLEKLYEEVGIKTIVLDPEKKAANDDDKKNLLHAFMYELAARASQDSIIPGTTDRYFLSMELLRKIYTALESLRATPRVRYRPYGYRGTMGPLGMYLVEASKRRIPEALKEMVSKLLGELAVSKRLSINRYLVAFALNVASEIGPMFAVSYVVARGMMSQTTREVILENPDLDWGVLYGYPLTPDQAEGMLNRFSGEIDDHLEGNIFDHDVAYVADFAKRIHLGQMVSGDSAGVQERAEELLDKLAELYPAVNSLSPEVGEPPDVTALLTEIDEAAEEAEAEEAGEEDEE